VVPYLLVAIIALALTWGMCAATPAEIKIGYLRLPEGSASISLLDTPSNTDGIAGAQLATADNNTTGRFTDQQFLIEDFRLKSMDNHGDVVAALAERGVSIVIADLPADALLRVADAGRRE
jgi:hypothetical protein